MRRLEAVEESLAKMQGICMYGQRPSICMYGQGYIHGRAYTFNTITSRMCVTMCKPDLPQCKDHEVLDQLYGMQCKSSIFISIL